MSTRRSEMNCWQFPREPPVNLDIAVHHRRIIIIYTPTKYRWGPGPRDLEKRINTTSLRQMQEPPSCPIDLWRGAFFD